MRISTENKFEKDANLLADIILQYSEEMTENILMIYNFPDNFLDDYEDAFDSVSNDDWSSEILLECRFSLIALASFFYLSESEKYQKINEILADRVLDESNLYFNVLADDYASKSEEAIEKLSKERMRLKEIFNSRMGEYLLDNELVKNPFNSIAILSSSNIIPKIENKLKRVDDAEKSKLSLSLIKFIENSLSKFIETPNVRDILESFVKNKL